jgi:hypothetical protein
MGDPLTDSPPNLHDILSTHLLNKRVRCPQSA